MDYVTKQDIPFIEKMFDENFGGGYMSRELMTHYIEDEDELFYAARRPDGRIAGILLYGPEDADTLAALTKIPKEELLSLAKGKPILKCRSMCIASDCQKGGIGRQLFADAIEDIKSLGKYGLITSCLWEYDGFVPAKSLHERHGFTYRHKLHMPWYNLEDYTCVYCKGRCRCDGWQYIRILDGK